MNVPDDLRAWVRGLRGVDDLGNKVVDFRRRPIPYVSKNTAAAAGDFGGTTADYDFWRPHMCGVCCVKSIGDALGVTTGTTLFDLIKLCVEHEVYRFDDAGDIRGAYHYPLCDLLRTRIGVPAHVAPDLSTAIVKHQLAQGKAIILSVDLGKSAHRRAPVTHLVTVYAHDPVCDTYTLHDCSSAIVADGCAAVVPARYLSMLSNRRGLVVG